MTPRAFRGCKHGAVHGVRAELDLCQSAQPAIHTGTHRVPSAYCQQRDCHRRGAGRAVPGTGPRVSHSGDQSVETVSRSSPLCLGRETCPLRMQQVLPALPSSVVMSPCGRNGTKAAISGGAGGECATVLPAAARKQHHPAGIQPLHPAPSTGPQFRSEPRLSAQSWAVGSIGTKLQKHPLLSDGEKTPRNTREEALTPAPSAAGHWSPWDVCSAQPLPRCHWHEANTQRLCRTLSSGRAGLSCIPGQQQQARSPREGLGWRWGVFGPRLRCHYTRQ